MSRLRHDEQGIVSSSWTVMVSRPASTLAALTAVSLLCFGLHATPAHGAQDTAPTTWTTIDAPPLPGSNFAHRLGYHSAEQRRAGPLASPGGSDEQQMSIDPFAANFATLPETAWALDHQEITVSVDPFTATLSAEVTATVYFHKAGVTQILFRLGLVDGLDVRDMDGQSVVHKYTEYFSQAGQIYITLPKPSKKDATWQVKIKYKRKMNCAQKTSPLRFCSFDNDIWSVAFYRYYLSHGSAYPAPFTSTLHVITPKDRVAAAPGTPTGPDSYSGDKLVWHFEQVERTTSAGFSIAKYDVLGDDPAKKIAKKESYLRMYTLPSFRATAKPLLKVARHVMTYFGERFSPFPWVGINIIQVANNFGGGYAPLAGTFMYKNVFGAKINGQGYTRFVELVAHELAHQWWGNLAKPSGSGDVSLSESMAEFSSCYYTEKVLKNRTQIVTDNLGYVYTVSKAQDRAMQANNVYGSPKYVQIIYYKGAVVFDMLRHELGDKVMFKGLTAYAKKFNRDYARVKDMQIAMETVSGRKLGWFFEQWWRRPGSIRVEFSGRVDKKSSGVWTVKLRVKQLTDKPFRFKLPIRVTFADGTFVDRDEDVIPVGDNDITIISFDVDKAVRGMRPDRTRKLLRRFQISTPGDVNLDGLVDGMDLMETAFRANRAIRYNNYFYPNSLWDELYDSKASYRIDGGDVSWIVTYAGAQALEF